MIKTDAAYANALKRLEADRESLAATREALRAENLSDEQIERVMQAQLSFHAQLAEEVAWYDSVRRGDVQKAKSLGDIGRILIGLRIAAGISQRELAQRIGCDESQVSRDERHEYFGITNERAQEIIDALGASVEITAQVGCVTGSVEGRTHETMVTA